MSSAPNKSSSKHNWSSDWIFPLKSSIFPTKSSRHAISAERIRKKVSIKMTESEDRLRMRRGSSMSDIDKIAVPGTMTDFVANHKISPSAASVPPSPYMSRSFLSSTTTVSVRGSIGDLMNLKKYGSSQWSVRSETLIAKMVPLSTVTPRHSPPPYDDYLPMPPDIIFSDENIDGPLTSAQRTQRLAQLLKQRKAYLLMKAKYYNSCRAVG
ncbi:hypothetical protein ABEB36_003727 [Hypothenemus hampei]|uniref:Uncharacterized protein n=1 Tax=Hypothenemus hampei TaxID=57062 RepID=A0ABD1F0X4_HYPHA